MNRVGEEGKGESVWLGWFLLKTLERLRCRSPRPQATSARADAWQKHARTLKKALEAAGLGRRMVSPRQL